LNKKKTRGLNGISLLLFVGMLVTILWTSYEIQRQRQERTYQEFRQEVAQNNVEEVLVWQNKAIPTGRLEFRLSGEDTAKFAYVSDVNEAQELLEESLVTYQVRNVREDGILVTTILPALLVLGGIILIFVLMNRQNAGGAKAMNFGKSKAKMDIGLGKKITFAQVAGLQEEKEELAEVVDFLKQPQKYVEVGARIPKGVLAKAVAGEAGVPFFTISGSDFVEMFVGVGAARVRDLFENAKKNAPCIIFIDEIDAVARRRGSGMGGGHDEREQTLNQLLVEMDGFAVNEGIIVMSATNRVDILDPAILRPGRFDRKVMVGYPDVKGREEILGVHAKGKPLGDDVDLKQVAQTTAGFTGADLENLLNEAAILAAKSTRKYIEQHDIREAFVKTGIGTEKKSRVISEKEKRITAYHEAGHAILFHVLPDVGPVHTVSIIPTGRAAGYTMPLPEKEDIFNTRGKMLQDITVSLGGRIAEEKIFNDITTGASQDIRHATSIARAMVMKFGMSEKLGMIHYGQDTDMGRELGYDTRDYGETVAGTIDAEVKRIVDECYAQATKIINENEVILENCANLLLEKEKITREEFEGLFGISATATESSETTDKITDTTIDEIQQ